MQIFFIFANPDYTKNFIWHLCSVRDTKISEWKSFFSWPHSCCSLQAGSMEGALWFAKSYQQPWGEELHTHVSQKGLGSDYQKCPWHGTVLSFIANFTSVRWMLLQVKLPDLLQTQLGTSSLYWGQHRMDPDILGIENFWMQRLSLVCCSLKHNWRLLWERECHDRPPLSLQGMRSFALLKSRVISVMREGKIKLGLSKRFF